MMWARLVVVCHVCVMCAGMSYSELEDFSNFLKETSQMDQNVKSNIPIDEYDEDEAVSDHAWEDSGKFEGDLILNERQRRMIVSSVAEGLARNGLADSTKRWPNNEVIYYIQMDHFTSDQVQAIQDGIDDLSRASCVKFKPYKKGDRDAVVIQGSRRGCFSQVGYQGGYQVLNLSGKHPAGRGCFRHGTVVHELLHTLGFYHMQSSPDRDEFIDVMWENIIKPARHNFRKYNAFAVSDFGVGYDYESVLHYSRKAFSSNGQDTLVPKKLGADIGQRRGLSEKDVLKLNKMYCDSDSDLLIEDTEPLKKSEAKRKSAKNKPFQGHGIGHQQGKTVVIRLPKAETYQLQDTPQLMFDYFSKTPQAMLPVAVQGVGARKEVRPNDYSTALSPNAQDIWKTSITVPQQINPRMPKIIKQYSQETERNEPLNEDLKEAFYRLSQISKPEEHTRELPEFNYDYAEFYNPIRVKTKDPEIENVDKLFGSSLKLDPDHYYVSDDKDMNRNENYQSSIDNSNIQLSSDDHVHAFDVPHILSKQVKIIKTKPNIPAIELPWKKYSEKYRYGKNIVLPVQKESYQNSRFIEDEHNLKPKNEGRKAHMENHYFPRLSSSQMSYLNSNNEYVPPTQNLYYNDGSKHQSYRDAFPMAHDHYIV